MQCELQCVLQMAVQMERLRYYMLEPLDNDAHTRDAYMYTLHGVLTYLLAATGDCLISVG